ncbi:hypothetical protein V1478_008245 [Vespula squamosa]|uniref:Uncharacterized protein n=1 Tax=Vespula squamosa TaxID=30214 RepID=A0ABD2AZ58_VESSQ
MVRRVNEQTGSQITIDPCARCLRETSVLFARSLQRVTTFYLRYDDIRRELEEKDIGIDGVKIVCSKIRETLRELRLDLPDESTSCSAIQQYQMPGPFVLSSCLVVSEKKYSPVIGAWMIASDESGENPIPFFLAGHLRHTVTILTSTGQRHFPLVAKGLRGKAMVREKMEEDEEEKEEDEDEDEDEDEEEEEEETRKEHLTIVTSNARQKVAATVVVLVLVVVVVVVVGFLPPTPASYLTLSRSMKIPLTR